VTLLQQELKNLRKSLDAIPEDLSSPSEEKLFKLAEDLIQELDRKARSMATELQSYGATSSKARGDLS
jgi:hypothetical protein